MKEVVQRRKGERIGFWTYEYLVIAQVSEMFVWLADRLASWL